ncbi:hypothetical protein BR93DRAFT_61000 [Coniochaeta sp. PMI_546]|nr:hypothetical protein BR93DRAFT_61000 [Coniochaeta sp. PMI_546]
MNFSASSPRYTAHYLHFIRRSPGLIPRLYMDSASTTIDSIYVLHSAFSANWGQGSLVLPRCNRGSPVDTIGSSPALAISSWLQQHHSPFPHRNRTRLVRKI